MQSPRRAITEKDGMNRGVASFVSSWLVEAYAQAFVRYIQCEGAITFTLKGRRTLPLNWLCYATSIPSARAGYHWRLLGVLLSISAERSLLWFQVVICSILQNLDANGNVSTLLERASIRGPASKWAIKHRDWSVAVSEKWLIVAQAHAPKSFSEIFMGWSNAPVNAWEAYNG